MAITTARLIETELYTAQGARVRGEFPADREIAAMQSLVRQLMRRNHEWAGRVQVIEVAEDVHAEGSGLCVSATRVDRRVLSVLRSARKVGNRVVWEAGSAGQTPVSEPQP